MVVCEQVYPIIRVEIDDKWIKHVCKKEGCKNSFIVIDGNEKNYRAICIAPKTKINGQLET